MSRPRINIIGQDFNGLTVLKWLGGPNSKYGCRCRCGKVVEVFGGNLRAGRAKTCGCGLRASGPRTFSEIARKLKIPREEVLRDYHKAIRKLRASPECLELLDNLPED